MKTAWRTMWGADQAFRGLGVWQTGPRDGSDVGGKLNGSGRRRARTGSLRWALVGATLALGACGSPRRAVPSETPALDEAQAATRAEDWSKAASLWHGLFLADPTFPVEPCREASRALLRLEDAESAGHLLD